MLCDIKNHRLNKSWMSNWWRYVSIHSDYKIFSSKICFTTYYCDIVRCPRVPTHHHIWKESWLGACFYDIWITYLYHACNHMKIREIPSILSFFWQKGLIDLPEYEISNRMFLEFWKKNHEFLWPFRKKIGNFGFKLA